MASRRRVNLHAVDALQAAHQRAAATALTHHFLQLFRTQLDLTLADVNGQRALRRQEEEVRQAIGCDALIYQDVDGMKRAIGSLNPAIVGFDASCFDGVYVTGDITADDIARLNEGRVGVEEGEEDTSRLALPNAQ